MITTVIIGFEGGNAPKASLTDFAAGHVTGPSETLPQIHSVDAGVDESGVESVSGPEGIDDILGRKGLLTEQLTVVTGGGALRSPCAHDDGPNQWSDIS